jgi:hypothetical protein
MVRDYGTIEAATLHAQDLATVFDHGGIYTMAAFDGAKDLAGTKWDAPSLAADRGLPGELLDGGEIAASVMQRYVEDNPTASGLLLAGGLNEALLDTYKEIGLVVDHGHRERLFTGYVGHVRINPEIVLVTGVGDVYVHINGELVVGVEKEIDRIHAELITALAMHLGRNRQVIYEALMPVLNLEQFRLQNYSGMKKGEVADYLAWIVINSTDLLGLSAEDIGRIADKIFREDEPLWYPAIDGTATPGAGVQIANRPRASLETIVIHTDGFAPLAPGHEVRGLYDLKPVNPEFSEQLAMVLDLRPAA